MHGQVVVPAGGGKFRTEDIQTGKVTAVSSSSLTVRSADGFTKSYRVTGATQVDAGKTGIGSVKVGNQVAITATVSGSTASLARVIDLSLLGRGRFAPGWGHQPPAAGDRRDVWARPGLPRDRAGPRHELSAGGRTIRLCGLRWRPGLAARPC